MVPKFLLRVSPVEDLYSIERTTLSMAISDVTDTVHADS